MTSTQSRHGPTPESALDLTSQPDQDRHFGQFHSAGLPDSADFGDVCFASDSAFARLSFTAATPWRTATIHLALKGEIDLSQVALLEDTLDQVIAFPACPITVELSAVTFMGSHGLGFLAALHRHIDGGGHRVTVTGAVPIVRRILQLSGFDELVTVIPSR